MVNKRLINTGEAIVPFDPLQNFETVTYTGNGGTQKITGYIRKGAAFGTGTSKITLPQTYGAEGEQFSYSLWFNTSSADGSYMFAKRVGENTFHIRIDNSFSPAGKICVNNWVGTAAAANNAQSTSGGYNDGSWHHFVFTYDGTRTPKTQCYIDGQRDTGMDWDYDLITQSGYQNNIGNYDLNNENFSGKLDQVRIFNTALNSTQVGELALEDYTDPKKSTTDYFGDGSGVALYELDEDANDTGGTGSVFTTWDDSLATIPNYSEGNLRMTGGSGNKIGYSKDPVSSGKFYWEHEVISIGGESSFGIARPGDLGSHYVVGTSSTSWGLYVNGNVYHNNSITTSGYMSGGFTDGDIIGVELDIDNGTLEFYKNGTGYGNAFTGLSGEFIAAAESRTSGGNNDHRTNFGASAWDYTPSTGFVGMPSAYNGTPTNVNFLGMAFQPDLVWVKNRSVAVNHYLYDSIRGTGAAKALHSNTTDSEASASTYSVNGGVQSIDSNGFTAFEGTDGTYQGTNKSGNNYVAWCWKAGGAAVTNTDGTITSQVSANPDAGFSIVKYTGNSGATRTIGHGLSSAPEMIILKNISDGAQHWSVYHSATGNGQVVHLNLTNAFSASGDWGSTTPTSTIFTIGSGDARTNSNGEDHIAYCFHSVDGYQKVGSYSGNGSTSGPIVETGFEPRFLIVKKTSAADDWFMFDSQRSPVNSRQKYIRANSSSAELDYGANFMNFINNGFQPVTTSAALNTSGGTYIYLAIA